MSIFKSVGASYIQNSLLQFKGGCFTANCWGLKFPQTKDKNILEIENTQETRTLNSTFYNISFTQVERKWFIYWGVEGGPSNSYLLEILFLLTEFLRREIIIIIYYYESIRTNVLILIVNVYFFLLSLRYWTYFR